VVIWYIFAVLVCLDEEKSGNPGSSIVCLAHLFTFSGGFNEAHSTCMAKKTVSSKDDDKTDFSFFEKLAAHNSTENVKIN
jgi:hypothetical protein